MCPPPASASGALAPGEGPPPPSTGATLSVGSNSSPPSAGMETQPPPPMAVGTQPAPPTTLMPPPTPQLVYAPQMIGFGDNRGKVCYYCLNPAECCTHVSMPSTMQHIVRTSMHKQSFPALRTNICTPWASS